MNTDDLIEKLTTIHFKELVKLWERTGMTNKNPVVDYPSMHNFLMKYYDKKDKNVVYNRLTHRVVPRLEWMKILTRFKIFDGTYSFRINKEKLL
jgi:hypothetical protein